VPGAEEGFQPNAVAGCLILFIPVQAALLIVERKLVAVQIALLALTASTLALTQSRGAWLGLAAAGLLALACKSSRTRRWTMFVLLPVAFAALVYAGPRRVTRWAVDQAGAGMAANTVGRPELWAIAVTMIREFPLTGVGMNGFRRVMPVVHPSNTAAHGMDDVHAHNHLLQAALDLGIPGLVAYLALWLVCGALLVAVVRHADERADRILARGLAVALLAHFLFSMTDAIPLGAKVGVLFWMALALVTSLHRVALVRSRSTHQQNRPPLTM
jgi:O-antigen ligase